ncbi:MAG: hypothetical protein U9Q81_03040, partial [Pseudomonadota bacterium]|nr:hypothetical protein [Pseudomonadota bacterium]
GHAFQYHRRMRAVYRVVIKVRMRGQHDVYRGCRELTRKPESPSPGRVVPPWVHQNANTITNSANLGITPGISMPL